MAIEYIERVESSQEISYYRESKILKLYEKQKKDLSFNFNVVLVICFICPPLAMFILISTFYDFFTLFFNEIFFNEKKFFKYKNMFSPKLDKKVLTVVGYRVKQEDVEEHISILKDAEALAEKQKEFQSPGNRHNEVGFDHKTLTTHVLLVGKTGSGKTEGVRSGLDDTMRIGAGINFNDGKSDVKMANETLKQAKKRKRETSAYIINLLKPDKISESNTISLIKLMHPLKLVNFLGELVDKGTSEGNARYFLERGKVLLLPIVQGLSMRDELLKEGITFEKIDNYMSISNLIQLKIVYYCMCRDLNEIILENSNVKRLIQKQGTKGNKDFQEIEQLIEYIIDNPSKKEYVEASLGIEYRRIREIYNNTYTILTSYLKQVWQNYDFLLVALEKIVYGVLKERGKIFYSNKTEEICPIEEIKNFYSELRDTVKEGQEAVNNFISLNGLELILDNKIYITNWVTSFNGDHTVEDPPQNAIQQHAFAMQQWTALFTLFIKYNHVFGQSKGEIDPKRAMLDNKIIYTLLPPLESGSDTEILGKILVMVLKEIAAISLGGERLSIHQTLKNILKDQISPKPFTFVFLDEYGAYPVPGLDLILQQVRSLNFNVTVGIQDIGSMKVNGTMLASQEKALANTMKWILKIEDKATVEWLKTMIQKKKIRKNVKKENYDGKIINAAETEVSEIDILNTDLLMNMDNGFSVIIGGSSEDRIIYLQSYYRGGEAETISLRKFINLEVA